jgi:hypothetical protein
MADRQSWRAPSAVGEEKVLDIRVYMCIITYIHEAAAREDRRRETVVPAGSLEAVASGVRVARSAARALHPGKLLGLRVRAGARQLRLVGTEGKRSDVAVCSRGVGARGSAGHRAWAAVAGVDARGGPALPGGSEERTRRGPSFRKKGQAEMIEPRYRQHTL